MTNTLKLAADYIEKNGWRQGPARYAVGANPVNVQEAIASVANNVEEITAAIADLVCYLEDHYLIEMEGWNRLGEWNDEDGQQMKNVAMHLRATPVGMANQVKHIPFKGNSAEYVITVEGRSVKCSCPGFVYRAYCWHVTEYRKAS